MSLEPHPPDVKQKRSYDGSRRRAKAEAAHAALLDAAHARFFADGYVATTVESIAADAAMSSATVYKSYGGKPGLVRALVQRALQGAGPVPAETRSNAAQRHLADPVELIEEWGRLVAEVSPRASPILLLLRDAAAFDEAAEALLAEHEASRLRRMGDNARTLADAGHLRPGVTWRDARDILWFHTAPELYDLLVRRRGWSVARYAKYLTRSMQAALLPDRTEDR